MLVVISVVRMTIVHRHHAVRQDSHAEEGHHKAGEYVRVEVRPAVDGGTEAMSVVT